ncbi:MAG: hypothetical protein LBJ69_00355 [Holosporales bacterium]|jgi:hypothetical protein|nr:hypothetical protein [Holosporales bacterium]
MRITILGSAFVLMSCTALATKQSYWPGLPQRFNPDAQHAVAPAPRDLAPRDSVEPVLDSDGFYTPPVSGDDEEDTIPATLLPPPDGRPAPRLPVDRGYGCPATQYIAALVGEAPTTLHYKVVARVLGIVPTRSEISTSIAYAFSCRSDKLMTIFAIPGVSNELREILRLASIEEPSKPRIATRNGYPYARHTSNDPQPSPWEQACDRADQLHDAILQTGTGGPILNSIAKTRAQRTVRNQPLRTLPGTGQRRARAAALALIPDQPPYSGV